ncbi:MAG: hypothetical protein ACI9DC_001523 [Gammaproteobacteria bacterium]|jgi:hypothetical protein
MHHVPQVYGARRGLNRDAAWALMETKLKRVEGTLQWYAWTTGERNSDWTGSG